eukprot:CAMPEP_0177321934 /NCGR_PEP_ID=MMETSP0368-20130122/15932_1 /TAXON_ID=447022 ORGANISM="Scrippsiella hangoei-like, Strain SHHI-4" /NCGR_SAMPLE_ID=MMETSP0368 /ASSEMBLY_ACC=CAM_ASM_000363 /LENGTH=477 /DNA_ID=CAMNT_0018781583 /DNA_START=21 /DNA_END=1454 /DNA_ORIENTATION=-
MLAAMFEEARAQMPAVRDRVPRAPGLDRSQQPLLKEAAQVRMPQMSSLDRLRNFPPGPPLRWQSPFVDETPLKDMTLSGRSSSCSTRSDITARRLFPRDTFTPSSRRSSSSSRSSSGASRPGRPSGIYRRMGGSMSRADVALDCFSAPSRPRQAQNVAHQQHQRAPCAPECGDAGHRNFEHGSQSSYSEMASTTSCLEDERDMYQAQITSLQQEMEQLASEQHHASQRQTGYIPSVPIDASVNRSLASVPCAVVLERSPDSGLRSRQPASASLMCTPPSKSACGVRVASPFAGVQPPVWALEPSPLRASPLGASPLGAPPLNAVGEVALAFSAWRTYAWRSARARMVAVEVERRTLAKHMESAELVCEELAQRNVSLEGRARQAEGLWQDAIDERQELEMRLGAAEAAAERAARLSAEASKLQAAAIEELRKLDLLEGLFHSEEEYKGKAVELEHEEQDEEEVDKEEAEEEEKKAEK